MRIDNAQQMLQHIDAGGALAVGNDGTLKTQNAAAQFFQRVGDAFRQLSSSGRASIAERNERLYGAMAEMVRRDNALPNLAASGPGQGQAVSQAEKNILCMRQEVGRQVASLPPQTRTCARNYLQGGLERAGQLEGTPEQVRAAVRNAAQQLRNKPDMLRAFRQDGALRAEARAAMIREMSDHLKETYLGQRTLHIKNGLHDSYLGDAVRGAITSINGGPLRTERLNEEVPFEGEPGSQQRVFQGIREQICELIPDQSIRGFVTMMASQAGLEGALYIPLMLPTGGMRPDPQTLCGWDMPQHGLILTTPLHHYSIDVTAGQVDIHMSFDARVEASDFLGTDIRKNDAGSLKLGGGHYECTLSVPLNQQVAEGEVPDFSFSEFTRTPLQP